MEEALLFSVTTISYDTIMKEEKLHHQFLVSYTLRNTNPQILKLKKTPFQQQKLTFLKSEPFIYLKNNVFHLYSKLGTGGASKLSKIFVSLPLAVAAESFFFAPPNQPPSQPELESEEDPAADAGSDVSWA